MFNAFDWMRSTVHKCIEVRRIITPTINLSNFSVNLGYKSLVQRKGRTLNKKNKSRVVDPHWGFYADPDPSL
jgi:hypothetical protein